MPRKPESLYAVVSRVENTVDSRPHKAQTVTLDVADVERLLHAAIWGDE